MNTNPAVEQRIAQALTENAGVLDLTNLRLERVPESVRELTGLTQLRLPFNLITEVPDWLGELGSLRELNLTGASARSTCST
ncbi:hypothetical protein AB0J35_44910 [Nonomuraea angiospora]|uniref:hypothetical protein n=1 Tax=Nonomuraea angiospora TaxID=46172 RepID=UPI00341628A5